MLSWTTLRASYNTKYNWLASSLLERTGDFNLGNTLSNTQTRTINGELKFEELYYKSRLLRAVNSNLPNAPGANKDNNKNNPPQIIGGQTQQDVSKAKPDTIRNKKGKIIKIKKPKKKKEKKVKEKKDPNQLPEVSAVPRFFLRLATRCKKGRYAIHRRFWHHLARIYG